MSSSLYQGIGTTPQQLTTTSQQLQGYVTSAEQAATNAGTSQTAAETALDLFDDRFLGAKNSDPTLDNDGNALVDGALYFDSTLNVMKVYDLAGTAWLQLNLSSSQQASVNTLVSVITPTNHIAALGPVATEIATVAGQISPTNNVAAVAGDATNIGLVAGVSTNITTVAGQISPTNNIATVAGRDADISTVAARDANIGTVAGRDADIATVAARDSNIGTLASISGDITSLANALGATTTYVVTVAGGVYYIDGVSNPTLTFTSGNTYIFDLSDSTNTGHPLAFKDGSGNSYTTGVTTTNAAGSTGAQVQIDVAAGAPASLRYYCTVHGNGMGNTISVVNSNLSIVASNITSVNTVANSTNIANITAVAGDATDIGTVATDLAGSNTIGTVATNLSGTNTIGSVGGAITNINNVAGALTAINNVNSNLASVNNFGDTYFVSGTTPGSPTAGDLWFDTGNSKLKVYDGSAFNDAGSVVNGTSERSTYTVGTSSGGYTGSTTVFPATYDVGFVDLYLNGIKLTPSDFTATNGTSITLNAAAATNDTVDIVAYGMFNLTVAQANASNLSSGTIPDARFPAALPAVDGSNLTGINTALVGDTSPQLGGELDTNGHAIRFGASKWTIELDTGDNDLNFKYNGTTVFKLSSAGAVVAADNITGYGTP